MALQFYDNAYFRRLGNTGQNKAESIEVAGEKKYSPATLSLMNKGQFFI